MHKRTKGFTLIEIVIVVVIIGILSVILLRTYTWISQIVFRVQQTRNVHQEVLQVTQVMQNFSDTNVIDFSHYSSGLEQHQGLVNTLYLSGKDGPLSFYITGDCTKSILSGNLILTGKCYIEMVQSGSIVQLTDPDRVNIRNLIFKIIPFASSNDYLQNDAPCPTDYLHCVHKPGFRMLFDAYSINYGTQWTNRVHIPMQMFF